MTKEEAIEILKTDSCVDCGVGSQSPCACTFDGHCDIKDAMKMAIKALEIVEEFENARIITGGRLNGRTYAYKRGLEDGKRKALEEINEEQAKVIDSSEIDIQKFTEAMKRQPLQVVNHPSEQVIQPCEDCVSRKELLRLYGNRAFELQKTHQTDKQLGINWCINTLNELPPVTPTHGTCENCRYNKKARTIPTMCDKGHRFELREPSTFYCADFEKRGNENG